MKRPAVSSRASASETGGSLRAMAEGGARGVPIRRIAAVLVGLVVAAALLPLSIAAVTVRAQDTFNRHARQRLGHCGDRRQLHAPGAHQGLQGRLRQRRNRPQLARGQPRGGARRYIRSRHRTLSFRVSTDKLAVGGSDLHLHGRAPHQQPVRVLAESVVPARPHSISGASTQVAGAETPSALRQRSAD